MSKTGAPYPPEFRQQMVEALRADRTPEALAREFGPPAARRLGELRYLGGGAGVLPGNQGKSDVL